MQWVNQRNLRIVLEHVTAELLQAQPDDPLEFMIDVLQKGQKETAQVARERPQTAGVPLLPMNSREKGCGSHCTGHSDANGGLDSVVAPGHSAGQGGRDP